jgi:hypothetical protein
MVLQRVQGAGREHKQQQQQCHQVLIWEAGHQA